MGKQKRWLILLQRQLDYLVRHFITSLYVLCNTYYINPNRIIKLKTNRGLYISQIKLLDYTG